MLTDVQEKTAETQYAPRAEVATSLCHRPDHARLTRWFRTRCHCIDTTAAVLNQGLHPQPTPCLLCRAAPSTGPCTPRLWLQGHVADGHTLTTSFIITTPRGPQADLCLGSARRKRRCHGHGCHGCGKVKIPWCLPYIIHFHVPVHIGCYLRPLHMVHIESVPSTTWSKPYT